MRIEQFSTGGCTFRIKKAGTDKKEWQGALIVLAFRPNWMAQINGRDHVKKGDVVLDCGAHVGVFTDIALRRGASKVVAIEPDPVNLELSAAQFLRRDRSRYGGAGSQGRMEH